jgi:hypothetical protein
MDGLALLLDCLILLGDLLQQLLELRLVRQNHESEVHRNLQQSFVGVCLLNARVVVLVPLQMLFKSLGALRLIAVNAVILLIGGALVRLIAVNAVILLIGALLRLNAVNAVIFLLFGALLRLNAVNAVIILLIGGALLRLDAVNAVSCLGNESIVLFLAVPLSWDTFNYFHRVGGTKRKRATRWK